jgi:hypothetical protein
MKVAILGALPGAVITIGDDAATHMMHYMRSTGLDYTIDLEGMVAEVISAKDRYEHEVAQMQAFIEKLPVGSHSFTSRRPNLGTNSQEENRNWFFATGSYVSWGKGIAKVSEGPAIRSYEVDFEYKFFDRYNWDNGKKVELAGITITDAFMGEFHRQGLAREFIATDRSDENSPGSRARLWPLNPHEVKRAMAPLRSFNLKLVEEVEAHERLKRGDLGELDNLHGLGRTLVALRIALGLMQRELAERLDVNESQVSRDERNEYQGITVDRASRILDALGVTLKSAFQTPIRVETRG